MKQTAVEWLEDCLREQYPNGKFVWNTRSDIEALFKRAKEMENQQQGYSEEEVIAFGEFIFKHTFVAHSKGVKDLFEQFKKK
jgi:hypothetical protein